MACRLPQTIAVACLFGATAESRQAVAQVHWDVGAELGAMDRLATGRDATVRAPTPGPAAELHGHVALVPMVRVGAYVSEDISPRPGIPARETTEVGLRGKLSPPLLSGPWRSWIFLGIGYARAYVAVVEGGVIDLPLGAGIGYRLRRPWQIFAELEGRVGLGFSGPLYARVEGEPYEGKDSFAVSLSVGVSLDE